MTRLTIPDFDLFHLLRNNRGSGGRIVRVNGRPGEGAMMFMRNAARVYSKHAAETVAHYDPETSDSEHLVMAVGAEEFNGDVLGVDYMVRRIPNEHRDRPHMALRLNDTEEGGSTYVGQDHYVCPNSQYRSELDADLLDAVRTLHVAHGITVFFLAINARRLNDLAQYISENNLTVVCLYGTMDNEEEERELWAGFKRALEFFDISLRAAYKDPKDAVFYQSISWRDTATKEMVKRYNVYQLSKMGTFVLLDRPEAEVNFVFI